MARTAEGVGFDSLWVGDHLLYDLPGGVARGPWEAWTALAALAAATERVELGPLVASTSFHAPAMLGRQETGQDRPPLDDPGQPDRVGRVDQSGG